MLALLVINSDFFWNAKLPTLKSILSLLFLKEPNPSCFSWTAKPLTASSHIPLDLSNAELLIAPNAYYYSTPLWLGPWASLSLECLCSLPTWLVPIYSKHLIQNYYLLCWVFPDSSACLKQFWYRTSGFVSVYNIALLLYVNYRSRVRVIFLPLHCISLGSQIHVIFYFCISRTLHSAQYTFSCL